MLKYLDIVVDDVWDIRPWPENLIKNIATNKIGIEYILEKKKHAKAKSGITNKENLNTFTSSIFFPNHIKRILLSNVAEAKIEPNCPWVIDRVSLMLELKSPRKKLCPKLEKNVKINPNTITFKLKLLNIEKNYDL